MQPTSAAPRPVNAQNKVNASSAGGVRAPLVSNVAANTHVRTNNNNNNNNNGLATNGAPNTNATPNSSSSTSSSSSVSSHAASSGPIDYKLQFERLLADSRAYRQKTTEELETFQRREKTGQMQLQDLRSKLLDRDKSVSELSVRVGELSAQLNASRKAAEAELNFFNLEVEKELARSKEDKEKMKLQQTLASYEDAHQKNKKIIETLNAEIIKLKQAYKAVIANGVNKANTLSTGEREELEQLRIRLKDIESKHEEWCLKDSEWRAKLASMEEWERDQHNRPATQIDDNQEKIQQLEAVIAKLSLNSSPSNSSNEISMKLETLDLLEKRLNEKNMELQNLQREYAKCQQIIANIESEKQVQQGGEEEKLNRIKQLQDELMLLKDENMKLKQQQQDEIDKVIRKKDDEFFLVKKTQQEAYESDLQHLKADGDAKEREYRANKAEADKSIKALKEQLANTISEHDKYRQQQTKKNADYDSRILLLNSNLSELKTKIEFEIRENADKQQALLAQLNAAREQAAEYETASKKRIQQLEENLKEQQDLYEKLDERSAEEERKLKSALAIKSSEYDALNAAFQKLQSELSSLRDDHDKLKRSNESLESDKVDLQLQCRQAKQTLKIYHDQIESNMRKREEELQKLRSTPVKKKSGFLDSIAAKLKLNSENASASGAGADDSKEDIDMFKGAQPQVTSKEDAYQLHEEVAVSLSHRIQKLEEEKLELQRERESMRDQLSKFELYNNITKLQQASTPHAPNDEAARERAKKLKHSTLESLLSLVDSLQQRQKQLEVANAKLESESKKQRELAIRLTNHGSSGSVNTPVRPIVMQTPVRREAAATPQASNTSNNSSFTFNNAGQLNTTAPPAISTTSSTPTAASRPTPTSQSSSNSSTNKPPTPLARPQAHQPPQSRVATTPIQQPKI